MIIPSIVVLWICNLIVVLEMTCSNLTIGRKWVSLQEGKAVFCGNSELMKWICLVKWWKLIELKCPIVWYWCFWSFWVSSQHLMDDFQPRGTQRILRNRGSAAVHLYAWEPSPGQYSIIIKRLRREKKLCILASVNNRDLLFV